MTNEKAIEILKYHKCPDGKGMDCGKYSCAEHHEAIDKAVEALKATTWIPCSERLPQNNRSVLAFLVGNTCGSGTIIRVSSCDNGHWFIQNDHYTLSFPCLEYDVVKWMPLPEPYTESVKQ